MRLFVAVDPSPQAVSHLREALAGEQDGWRQLRWSPPQLWHLTLAFLGEVAPGRVDGLAERLVRAAHRSPSFELALMGLGAFATRRRANVVWVGVGGDVEPLRHLATRCAAAARHSGIDLDDKRFRAHLTLARAKHPPFDASAIVERLGDYAGPPWRVEEMRLVRSHLGAQVRHETLRTMPLG